MPFWNIWIVAAVCSLPAQIAAYDPFDYREEYNLANLGPEPEVFITLSARVLKGERNGIAERRVQLNWFNIDVGRDSTQNHTLYLLRRPAGLFRIDEEAVYKREIGSYSDGQVTTHLSFPRVIFNKSHMHDECMEYWVAMVRVEYLSNSMRQRTVVAQNCFRAQPFWMWKNEHLLKHLTLRQMMIPGTHNSGMYSFYNPRAIRVMADFKYTQEEDIFNQLAYGIRCLDLRISASGPVGNPKYRIVHDLLTGDASVVEVLQQVKDFIRATNEIVILDFHRFPNGFDSEYSHQRFLEFLRVELGETIVPYNSALDRPLSHIWQIDDCKGRIVICYNARLFFVNQSLHLGVRHLWADTNNQRSLKAYFDKKVCEAEKYGLYYFHAAMAELTPNVVNIIFEGHKGGLRKMADETNPLVARWFRREFRTCANIVATDFFLGADIVSVAISSNIERSKLYRTN